MCGLKSGLGTTLKVTDIAFTELAHSKCGVAHSAIQEITPVGSPIPRRRSVAGKRSNMAMETGSSLELSADPSASTPWRWWFVRVDPWFSPGEMGRMFCACLLLRAIPPLGR